MLLLLLACYLIGGLSYYTSVQYIDTDSGNGYLVQIDNPEAIPDITSNMKTKCNMIVNNSRSYKNCGWLGNGVADCRGFVSNYIIEVISKNECNPSVCPVAQIVSDNMCHYFFFSFITFSVGWVLLALGACIAVPLVIWFLVNICANKRCCSKRDRDNVSQRSEYSQIPTSEYSNEV